MTHLARWILLLVLLLSGGSFAQQPAAVRRTTPATDDPGIVVRQSGVVGVSQTANTGDGGVFWFTKALTNNPDGGTTLTEQTVWETPTSHCARSRQYRGKLCTVVRIMGRRSQGWNTTTTYQDVAQYLDLTQDLINPVSTATTYYLRSSSVLDLDVDGGSGARVVRIVYLLDGGVPGVSNIPLNGTTGVSLGTGYTAFQWTEVGLIGSASTTGTAIGSITISSVVGAPTTAQTVEYSAASSNRSLSARYTVPAATTCYLTDWDITAQGGATFDTRLRVNVFSDDNTLSDSTYNFVDTEFAASGNQYKSDLPFVPLPAGAVVKVSALPSAAGAGNRLDISFEMLCVAN